MKSKNQNIGEFYSSLAMSESNHSTDSIVLPKIKDPRDMVYNGSNERDYHTAGVKVEELLKKESKRKLSPFTIILILIGIAIASVLYIGNILTVSRLLIQNNQLQYQHKKNLDEQEILKAQINRLSSLERIQKIATEQLMMRNPKNLPNWLEINEERIREVETILQQKTTREK